MSRQRLTTCPVQCPLDAASLHMERDRLAERVDSLWRQRRGFLRLLASIRANGGVAERHWRKIDGILIQAGLLPAGPDATIPLVVEQVDTKKERGR